MGTRLAGNLDCGVSIKIGFVDARREPTVKRVIFQAGWLGSIASPSCGASYRPERIREHIGCRIALC